VNDQPIRLLIVDDDPELLQFLLDELRGEDYDCTGFDNGHEALLYLRQQDVDLAILDWSLPDLTGVEICSRLRKTDDTTPVLMLTARDAIDERVHALDAGVDDYLVKPFAVKELHARVRACLRRVRYEQQSSAGVELMTLGDLKLDPVKRTVLRADEPIGLSQREFELLNFLVSHANHVQHRQAILDAVWGAPFVGDPNILDVYMGYLRKKIERKGAAKLLHTIRGVGFMARVDDPTP